MANQKTYSIIINGIKESINDIENLLSKLDNLDNKLTQLEDKVVNIKVQENVTTTTTTKQTTTKQSSSNTALENEILKNEQLKNAEYQQQLQLLQQIKQENKELEKLNKDIADGVRNIDGSYTNTLASMRRQLSDMKKELSHMDIDDVDGIEEMTLQIKELNDQVKQMEADYCTFSRNVGNYTDSMVDALNEFDGQMNETIGDIVEVKNGVESLKGSQMFDVDIAGQVVQFENISQAIGEIDDMAHRASVQMMELANAGKQNTEEYARLSAEFQEYINTSANLERARKYADELKDSMASTTRGLDMAVQGFQALGNVMQMANGVAGLFGQNQEEIEKAINRTVQTMAILQSAQELYQHTIQQGTFLNKAWNASLAASEVVMKMLGITTKATTISMKLLKGAIAATGIGLLVIAITEAINLVYDLATGLSKVEKQMVNNAQQIDRFVESTDKLMGEVKKMNDLKVELKLMTDLENSADMLAKFKDNYKLLVKDIQQQNTKLEGKWNDLFSINTRQLDVDKKKIIQLLSSLSFEYNRAKDIVDQYKQAVADSSTDLNEETIATYQNAQAKVALYESLVKVLEAQNNYNKSKDAEKEKEKQKAKERRNNRIQVEREIEDKLLSIMKDGNTKRMEELKLQKKRELEDAELRKKQGEIKEHEYQKLISAIKQEYAEKEKDEMNQHYDEINNLKKELERSLINDNSDINVGMFDGLLQKNYRDIDKLKEQIGAFHKIYEEGYEKNVNDVKFNTFGTTESTIFDKGVRTENVRVRTTTQKALEELKNYYVNEFNLTKLEEAELYDLLSRYSGAEVGLVIETLNTRFKLQNEYFQREKSEENKRYDELLQQAIKAEEKELDNIELTEKEKQDIKNKYQKLYEEINDNHYKRIDNLLYQHRVNMLIIEDEANKERSEIISKYHDTVYNEYRKHYDQLNQLRDKYSNIDEVNLPSELSSMGSFTTQILEMKKFKDSFKTIKDEVVKQKEELKKQFKDGVISEDAFNKSYAQLDQLEYEIKTSLDKISMDWKDWATGIAEVASSMVSVWSQTLSMLYDVQYNNEMLKIEKLQEAYDEENEMLSEKLEEQEELYDKHNQNIEDIEGELQIARGDRRLFLLDQINAEMMKREQAYNQQVKIQKQQEALEKKKEQLEQKREALEKKRNKQNQKIQIAKGLASTALSVVNALSVQPFWLGLAMSALAASMGAAQVAIISSQKFANGGVIQGASHKDGGVPVFGGRVEVEGGEYITNKVTTSKNVDILTFINSKKKKLDLSDFIEFYSSKQYANGGELPKFKYANGGQMPTIAPNTLKNNTITVKQETQQPIYVSVQEIENVQNKLRSVRVVSGLEE